MKQSTCALALCLVLGGACSDKDDDDGALSTLDGGTAGLDASLPSVDAARGDGAVTPASPLMSFFVTSQTSTTGNLGGLTGADARCQALATSVGVGSKTWRAFLSVERDAANGNLPTEARSRIGTGPWYNAEGKMLAANVTALLALAGNADVFIDERGHKINGQWTGSPTPNEHDILTGTEADGGVAIGKTCADWTSAAASPSVAVVGHADGLGPSQNANPPLNSWYSAHDNGGCNDTAPRGGAGRLYCFAAN